MNCKGSQKSHNTGCSLKGNIMSKERVKDLCGCSKVLLQCQLVQWIKEIQEDLVPLLRENEEVEYPKYDACKQQTCANRSQVYEWIYIYQASLRQMLHNSTMISYFSLNCQSNLEPILYQRLKEWVEQEDNTFDNKEAIEEMIRENQPVSKEYLDMQE